MDIDVDYSPTDGLVDQPLDPCPQPWLKARRTELSAYWRQADAFEVAAHLVERERAYAWLAIAGDRPRRATLDGLRAAIERDRPYDLYFAPDDRTLLFPPREPWRRLPVIHLDSPTAMLLGSATGNLYHVRWATEVIVDGRAVAHDRPLVELGVHLRRFLDARFVGRRGMNCRDSPEELGRLGIG
jgi:hypothetical protein